MPSFLFRSNYNKLLLTTGLLLTMLSFQGCTSLDLGRGLDFLNTSSRQNEITLGDIASAFKEALQIGSENVTVQLGREEGFNKDQGIRIPLPKDMERVGSAMRKVGLGSLVDDFEVKLNRAAERAAPLAKEVLWNAIKDMTFRDVKQIYDGPDDAATRYFEAKTSAALKLKIQPIIDDSLSKVGAIRSYDRVMSKYSAIPFVPDVKADISGHVVDGTLSGVFHYLAKGEAAIRKNPAKRTTELLKKVFGAKD